MVKKKQVRKKSAKKKTGKKSTKKSSKRKSPAKHVQHSTVHVTHSTPTMHKEIIHHEDQTSKILVSNFIALQKVMTNLSVKLDDVATKMSKLLDLFEISAKAMAEKNFDLGIAGAGKGMEKKLDNLLDQNKVIARGLSMMHDRISGETLISPTSIPESRPLPQMQPQQKQSQQLMPPTSFTQKPAQQGNLYPFPPSQGMPQNPNATKSQGYQQSVSTKTSETPEESAGGFIASDEQIQR